MTKLKQIKGMDNQITCAGIVHYYGEVVIYLRYYCEVNGMNELSVSRDNISIKADGTMKISMDRHWLRMAAEAKIDRYLSLMDGSLD